MVESIELIIVSFLASLGFAIVFQIRGKDLLWAGLGGAVTRLFYMIFMAFIPYRIVYAGLAALVAAIYAELLATYKKTPSTVFLYPSIIPLIPGDLIYYTFGGLILGEMDTFGKNGLDCIFSLVGISVGFVLASTIAHYVRRYHVVSGTVEWIKKRVFH